jgi:hypothetical protein
MSSVVIAGNTSGSVTLDAPAVAGTTVLTLPATSGTVVTTATTTGISGSAISTGTVGVSVGGTGANTLTANNVILGNGTSAVQFVAPGSTGNVLTSNGTTWTSAAAGGGQLQTQIFGSPGTWTNPGTVTRVRVAVTGGGGGGAAFSQARTGGEGGRAGAMITIPTSPVAITCGGAGNGGSFPGGGTPGGTSSFGSYVSCTGGTGAPTGTPGTNGSATITGPAATILRPDGNYSTNTFLGGGSLNASPSPGPQNGVAFSGPGTYGAGFGGPGINSQPGFAAGGTGGGVVVEFVG